MYRPVLFVPLATLATLYIGLGNTRRQPISPRPGEETSDWIQGGERGGTQPTQGVISRQCTSLSRRGSALTTVPGTRSEQLWSSEAMNPCRADGALALRHPRVWGMPVVFILADRPPRGSQPFRSSPSSISVVAAEGPFRDRLAVRGFLARNDFPTAARRLGLVAALPDKKSTRRD